MALVESVDEKIIRMSLCISASFMLVIRFWIVLCLVWQVFCTTSWIQTGVCIFVNLIWFDVILIPLGTVHGLDLNCSQARRDVDMECNMSSDPSATRSSISDTPSTQVNKSLSLYISICNISYVPLSILPYLSSLSIHGNFNLSYWMCLINFSWNKNN